MFPHTTTGTKNAVTSHKYIIKNDRSMFGSFQNCWKSVQIPKPIFFVYYFFKKNQVSNSYSNFKNQRLYHCAPNNPKILRLPHRGLTVENTESLFTIIKPICFYKSRKLFMGSNKMKFISQNSLRSEPRRFRQHLVLQGQGCSAVKLFYLGECYRKQLGFTMRLILN